VFKIPDPDGYLSASDVKDVAEEVISPLPLPGVEGSPLDPGDIWLVVIMACVNQNSICLVLPPADSNFRRSHGNIPSD
jgi:hypothetical protein